MADFCPHFVDEVCLLAWHRGFRESQRNLRCAKCQRVISIKYNGEYVPWGPSSDDDEAVRVEMEATRLALHRIHDDWPDDEPEDEWADYGWAAYELGCDVYDGTWHGWLANHIVYEHEDARCIATHTDDEGGAR